LYDIPSNDGDIIFLLHIIDSLKDEDKNGNGAGRAIVIIPEGILFRKGSKDDKKLRELLLNNCDVEAIISLPQGIFRP
ncbi:N-6 DNA methylase, partial [Escherichia coli]|uniref:N-6 DNA methylase n=1 Tax=Escherichia coli TaxID=562 RepID=UPI003CE5C4F7